MKRSEKTRELNKIADSIERSVISDIVSGEKYSDHIDEFLEIHDLSNSLQSWKRFDSSHAWKKLSYNVKPAAVRLNWMKIAIAASVVFLLGVLVIIQFSDDHNIYQSEGALRHMVLSDGSDIILEEGSLLSVSSHFNKKNRNVGIKGKAYFNVAANIETPFIISAGEYKVRVIGTEFYISAEENHVIINLLEGKISVEDKNGEITLIESGQSLVLSGENRMLKTNADDIANHFNADIKFDNISLNDAINHMNNLYERDVIMLDKNTQNIGTETIYTTVRNSSIREFARFIEIVFDANVINSKGQYIISLKNESN